MRFTISSLSFLLITSSTAQSSHTSPLLRGDATATTTGTSPHRPFAMKKSSCLGNTSESSCNRATDESDGSDCVWCKCSAVPSSCFSGEQAAHLPPGVFDCASAKGAEGTAASYVLEDDEVDGGLCDADSRSLSGYVDITGSKYDTNGEDKHLFYWFFEKRASAMEGGGSEGGGSTDAIPLILWLTGGPGCSSTLALLAENGPCRVSPDGLSTTRNPSSWTETAHVLWLDQPAGVGFSYGTANDYNEEMISEDAYYFLQGFFAKHPEYRKNPLFVVGESYGGHYAPAIAHKVWEKNKGGGGEIINLAGLGIGNGLTKPSEQYKWYPEMAYNNSHGIKTVTLETYNAMLATVPKCVALIEECNKGNSIVNRFACQTAFVVCNAGETVPYQMTGLNPYDIRLKCGDSPLCYDFSAVEKWLNLDSTKTALHVREESRWQSCNMGINLKFHTDWMKDFSPYVADLLNANIPALIYAGDVDFVCNYMGNRAWTKGLDWMSGDGFRAAGDHEWEDTDGTPLGLARSADGFTFLQVYDAGHMVPSDQPEVALKMISHFVEGGVF